MIAEELKLVIRTEAEKAVRDLKKYQTNVSGAKSASSGLEKKLASFAKGMLAAGGIVLAFRMITKAVKEMVTAYGVQETAETKLRAAIRASGKEAIISADALYDYASELQGMTTYGDEATISAMAMLQQLGDLNEEGLKKTIPLVQDFAAAMGVDLETAASLVGKTLGSSTNALSRYGLEIDMTGTKEEKLTSLTDAMRKKFGGMAGELAQTGTGSLKQYNNALGDLKEMGGEVILEFLQPGIQEMTTLMTRTLQAWDAQRKLNKAFAGQASTLQDAKDAFQESQLRLNQLNDELKTAEKRALNANTVNLKMGGTIRDNTGKLKELIEKEEEANAMLLQQMKAMAAEEKIRAAVVIVTKSQVEEQDKLNESLGKGVDDLEAWIGQQTQIVAGFQDFTDQQIGINSLMGIFVDNLDAAAIAYIALTEEANNYGKAASDANKEDAQKKKVLIEKTTEYRDLMEDMTSGTIVRYGEAFGEALQYGIDAHGLLREAFKESVACALEAFAKMWAIEAAAAFWKGNFLKAAGLGATSIAALAGAGYVRSLATGGDYVTSGPETILVGDNPGGQERVSVTPVSSPNVSGPGQMVHVTFNLGGRTLYDDISRASENGELIIAPRSVRR